MPATVTLATTTLAEFVGAGDTRIRLTSTAGLAPNTRLYIDGEMIRVMRLGVDSWVEVQRGVDTTASAAHPSLATVYIGRADQFYSQDPFGRPNASIQVSPYINVRNGTVWFAQGDASNTSARWWQKQTQTYGVGAFGVRTVTYNLESST